jgi:hypothetical protein
LHKTAISPVSQSAKQEKDYKSSERVTAFDMCNASSQTPLLFGGCVRPNGAMTNENWKMLLVLLVFFTAGAV